MVHPPFGQEINREDAQCQLLTKTHTHTHTHTKQSLGTPHLSSQYTTYTTNSRNGAANTAGLSSSKLFSEQTWCSTQLLCCILVSKSISFWYLQCGLLTKMLHVGVRTLTSSCFGFACARAQGTRHRRKRQVPCPLTKMIGRNRLQEFKHSFNQKNWPGGNKQPKFSEFRRLTRWFAPSA